VKRERAGEWARYLFRPLEVGGVPEDLRALAARMESALRAIAAAIRTQQVVAVSHGDPLKAGLLALTGGDLRELHRNPIPTGGTGAASSRRARERRAFLERWAAGVH
jgi:broad specificity phosphatase PhoE